MAKTTYVWDELSDNVIEEHEDGVLSVSYTHEPGLYGNLLSQNRNGVTSYYHYDGRGDTVALTDDAGNNTDTKEYDAWGNVIASTGSTPTEYASFGRNGCQSESQTRIKLLKNRFYNSTTGRMMSPATQRLTSAYSATTATVGLGKQRIPGNRLFEVKLSNGVPLPTNAGAGCGDKFGVKWDISFPNGVPCDGWLMQWVWQKVESDYCTYHPQRCESSYLEVWRVKAGNVNNFVPPYLGDDTFSRSSIDESRGKLIAQGVFFLVCNDPWDIDEAIWAPIDEQGRIAEHDGFFDPERTWERGVANDPNPLCNGVSSGILPHYIVSLPPTSNYIGGIIIPKHLDPRSPNIDHGIALVFDCCSRLECNATGSKFKSIKNSLNWFHYFP